MIYVFLYQNLNSCVVAPDFSTAKIYVFLYQNLNFYTLLNFFSTEADLCISILEFKYIINIINIIMMLHLCISILEFKYVNRRFRGYDVLWIYVFLYQNLNTKDFDWDFIDDSQFMYFYIRI